MRFEGGFRTKREALQAGSIAFSEYQRCGTAFEPSTMSFSDYLDLFSERHVSSLSVNSRLVYKRVIDWVLKPGLGSTR